MKIITRSEAKKLGLQTYFTGEPCRNGKKFERRVSNGHCLCKKCLADRAAHGRSYYARLKTEGAV
ncbi:hypothetical protein [Acinetobacter guillouiae]|uniref:hypothetical protein n=1 Tax=Acinetobacter guillouiae TaxID=106649 RepID=UPI003AF67639